MTTFDTCEGLKRVVLNNAAMVMVYMNWDLEFAANEIRNMPEKIRNADWFDPVNPNDLTADELDQLGFGLWSEDNPMRLIPLWLYPFLVDEFIGSSISGEKPATLRTIDLDTDARGGLMAYGVIPTL